MPYIEKQRREEAAQAPQSAGELNYAITRLLVDYIAFKGVNYSNINDCLGALSGASNEFYRRIAVPYEERKRSENGDVY